MSKAERSFLNGSTVIPIEIAQYRLEFAFSRKGDWRMASGP